MKNENKQCICKINDAPDKHSCPHYNYENKCNLEISASPESKEVESVPVKSAKEILDTVELWAEEPVIEAMETYASQFKQPANNEAVKVIEERIKELEAEITTPDGFHKTWLIQRQKELQNILKLIQ